MLLRFPGTGKPFPGAGERFSGHPQPFPGAGKPFPNCPQPFSDAGMPQGNAGKSFPGTGPAFPGLRKPFSGAGKSFLNAGKPLGKSENGCFGQNRPFFVSFTPNSRHRLVGIPARRPAHPRLRPLPQPPRSRTTRPVDRPETIAMVLAKRRRALLASYAGKASSRQRNTSKYSSSNGQTLSQYRV